jgi:penicillin-binding protein 2
MALAALETGKRTRPAPPSSTTAARGHFGGHTFRSHGRGRPGRVDMHRSIVKSSNVYYYSLANEMGVDLPSTTAEAAGPRPAAPASTCPARCAACCPATDWKRAPTSAPSSRSGTAGETISLGIGQGYNNFTMLQLASATATLVSGGQRFEPRLVREVEDPVAHQRQRGLAGQALARTLGYKPEHVAAGAQARWSASRRKAPRARVCRARPTSRAARPAPRRPSA